MALERIVVDPARMGGLPTLRDSRVTVGMVLGQLAAGQTTDDLPADYPYLERADVLAALEYAASAVNEREVWVAPTGVKLPLDANLSQRIAESLRILGLNAIHVVDLDLVTAM
ncbi:MAG TPA: DUF433 domain-containing protein [Microthrixaceae bacterium]|nr:DUF433 domain-containing protein [Microthrixaceae bacterium]